MSNTLTMILVLGGTLVVAIALLYASLTQERPRSRRSEREAAATAAILAARDPDTRE